MTQRLNPQAAAPALLKHYLTLSMEVEKAGIERPLLELVKIRASQINGCANCLNMHTRDAITLGVDAKKLHLLAAWQDAPCYDARERAALGWTEALTRVATAHPSDEDYAAFAAAFEPAEQVQLTMAIMVINGWNRLAVGFGLFYPDPA